MRRLRSNAVVRSVGSGGRPGVEDKGVADTAAAIDVRRFADTSHRFASHAGTCTHRASSIAKRLGINAARLSLNDDNMPQRKRLTIAGIEMQAVLIAGGEAGRS